MKKIVSLFIFAAISACQQHKVDPKDLTKINGYWEIEKVEMADGGEKQYKANTTYDYIEIKDKKGFRKKVTPQLNGTFLVDNTSEEITVSDRGGKIYLNYTTPYAKWKEELKSISDKEMVLENQAKNEYHYKKAEAINVTGNGKD